MTAIILIPREVNVATAEEWGFRLGERGTHATRTMMYDELQQTLATVPASGLRSAYAQAIIEENCLGKPTDSTRRQTNQRLGELYCLDLSVPLFRVLRRLWERDTTGHPLLAVLCALARDPLFAATVDAVAQLEPGAEFLREPMRAGIRALAGDRLNESTVDKVARNAASSWTQSGHLVGRALKIRRRVHPTPASITLALYLAYRIGFRGLNLFTSGWISILDCSPTAAQHLAFEAKRLGLLDIRMGGDIVEINFNRLEQPL